MTIRTTAWVVLGILGIGLAGYGLGSGWVRLGPPRHEMAAEAPPRLELPRDQADPVRLEFLRAPRVDDHVTQAQGGAGTTTAAALVEIRESLTGGPLASGAAAYVTRNLDTPVRLRSTTFTVKLSADGDASTELTVAKQGDGSATVTQDGTIKSQYAVDATSKVSGAALLNLQVPTGTAPPPGSKTFASVIVPNSNGLVPPTIVSVSNGRFAKPADFSQFSPGTPVQVFGNYLALQGQDAPTGASSLSFYLYVPEGSDFVFKREIANPEVQIDTQTHMWSAVLALPVDLALNTTARLFVVAQTDDNQQFSAPLSVSRVPFTLAAGDKPTITGIQTGSAATTAVASKTDATGSHIFVNTRQVYFAGTGVKAQTRVFIYVDGRTDPVATADPPADSTTNWTSSQSVMLDDNAAYTARAVLVQGNQTSPTSDGFPFLVSTVGPTIDSVQVNSPGPELGVVVLTVIFKGNVLNPTLARDVAKYSLKPTIAANSVAPRSADFDPIRNAVTLQFNSLPADNYTFQLEPAAGPATALQDVYGNAITGPTTRPVTNAPDGGDVVDGIPKPEKAPNVVYPEFNTPRPETNGFNPSDHVDTRVARLYFYRDARRVAEVINRDLKSYNQAAVDTRRRLAEKARTSADTLTDERRLQEIKAVRDAQATREIQRKLDQAQAALQQNQATVNRTSQDLPVLLQQQAVLNQQVTAANAPAGTPAENVSTPATPTPSLAALQAQLATVNARINQTQNQASLANSGVSNQTAAVQAAQNELQSARAKEAQSSDETVQDQAKEDRARENQFRLEVAAAQEDPNSYAPGNPSSIDPVLQVSISVIGEGIIQLRGPIKGINIIRRMINEIDNPAGQVRISLHTIQINGEHEERMEKVATRIQAYVDHSRFLTVQSAQMLRNSIVRVASHKAEEACALIPPEKASDPKFAMTQAFRDRKYQEVFFGVDFINELHEIDAEFLHTGNKLLSLHSMDTTSLASALFMLALAKNDTRMEILADFHARLEGELPEAEANFELSSGRTGKEHHHKVLPLAQNARFQSFTGFFNSDVAGNDTINPLQREFIKLAQILKSRLVVELEYNQRFKERSLIEDRLGNYQQELKEQKEREDTAKRMKDANRRIVSLQREKMGERLSLVAKIMEGDSQTVAGFKRDILFTKLTIDRMLRGKNRAILVDRVLNAAQRANPPGVLPVPGNPAGFRVACKEDAEQYLTLIAPRAHPRTPEEVLDEVQRLDLNSSYLMGAERASFVYEIDGENKTFAVTPADGTIAVGPPNTGTTADDLRALTDLFYRWIDQDSDLRNLALQFRLSDKQRQLATQAALALAHLNEDKVTKNPTTGAVTTNVLSIHIIFEYAKMLAYYSGVFAEVNKLLEQMNASAQEIVDSIGLDDRSPVAARQKWEALRSRINSGLHNAYADAVAPHVKEIDDGFKALAEAYAKLRNAERAAEEARQPLDAKKLLDMLLDEIEDKYIELLEGIRAHTANIDGYVKSIATALDDDFNTQFYYPAFQEIRKSSSFHDVQLGQVETTNILTNNRMFAKVEPQATMEFDLPKRDILINEAMNGAKAIMDTYGALVTDPSFLALTKLQSGQPTSSPAQGFGSGGNTVRNVLPGLPRSNDEQLLSQAPAGRREFGSPLEALIPDPAIYKFETGTGFEIRPVIEPDGQSVVFHLDYMYTTNVREPVRADEKHLGRIKRHFIDTEVQLGNYELREISRYTVALKASRTSRGVPLLEDIPGLGILFRPLPSASSSLQQNVILGQSTIFPTLFDLMGLRIAPAVADLDTLRLRNSEFSVRGRARDVMNRVFDYSTSRVDEYLRVPPGERRSDLYRSQETIPDVHPNGYSGPGLNQRDSQLQEGYDPTRANPPSHAIPAESREVPDPAASPTSFNNSRRRILDPQTRPTSGVRSLPGTKPRPSAPNDPQTRTPLENAAPPLKASLRSTGSQGGTSTVSPRSTGSRATAPASARSMAPVATSPVSSRSSSPVATSPVSSRSMSSGGAAPVSSRSNGLPATGSMSSRPIGSGATANVSSRPGVSGAVPPVISRSSGPGSTAPRSTASGPVGGSTNLARKSARAGVQRSPTVAASAPIKTGPRTDPATKRAAAVVTEPPPAQAARKSVLSRIFNSDQ